MKQVFDQLLKFLQQGIAAIFHFVELIWTWSVDQVSKLMAVPWQEWPLWKQLLLVLILAGCSANGRGVPQTNGQALFQFHCAPCHEMPPPDLLKEPPKLNGIFNSKTLPIASRATVLPPSGTTRLYWFSISDEEQHLRFLGRESIQRFEFLRMRFAFLIGGEVVIGHRTAP